MASSTDLAIGPPRDDAEIRVFTEILEESLSFPSADEFDLADHEGRENIRVARVDGRVVGGLVARPMGQWFGGRVVPMSGVRAVGVGPDQRGSGVGQALMRQTLNESRAAGIPLAALYPATQPVYRRPGFEQGGVWITYKLATRDCTVFERRLDVRRIEDADMPAIKRVYNERAKRTCGHLDRDDWLWNRVRNPRAGKAFGYLVHNGDRVEGYTIFTKQTVEPPPYYDLICTDVVAITPEAGRRLLTLFADHRSMAKHVVWKGPAADAVMLLQREQAAKIVDRLDWMLRIVDVKGALEARGYAAGVSGALHLDVRDDVLAHNYGKFIVEVGGGRAVVSSGGEGRLRIDIRGLAPLYSGHFSASELLASGYVEGDADQLAVADALFAGPAPWMPDIF